MFAFSDDGVYAYAMMPDTDAIAVFNLLTQISTGVYVQSAPDFVGVMPALHTAYIGESYPLGRLSFIISRNQCFVVPTETPFANHYIELWPNPSQVVVPDQVVVTPQGDMALARSEL